MYKIKNRKPLVVLPSSYSQVTEEKLAKEGANIVIYANHLLKCLSKYGKYCESILKNKRHIN